MKTAPIRLSGARSACASNFRRVLTFITLVISCTEFLANADVLVTDDGTSFSPDPANIVVGQTVFWQDDGTGPYQIISDTGAWSPFNTPGGVIFSQTGNFSYHDDLGNFGTVQVAPNLAPSVTITNPATNAVFSAPANFL